MEKRKNTEPVFKNKKCGRMGNLFENVFWLKVKKPASSVFYPVKIKLVIRKELEKGIKRIDKGEG